MNIITLTDTHFNHERNPLLYVCVWERELNAEKKEMREKQQKSQTFCFTQCIVLSFLMLLSASHRRNSATPSCRLCKQQRENKEIYIHKKVRLLNAGYIGRISDWKSQKSRGEYIYMIVKLKRHHIMVTIKSQRFDLTC